MVSNYLAKILYLLTFFVLISSTHAVEKIKTVILNSEMDDKSLDEKKFEVIHNKKPKSALPTTVSRNSLFMEAKLEQEVKSMDQLEMDILYLDAKVKKEDQLKIKYPNINISKLIKLKQLIENK